MAVRRLQHIHYKHLVPPNLYELGVQNLYPHYEIRGAAPDFFLPFFVSLSATLRENGWTDLHEIFREGVEWPWDNLIKFWANSGKRVGGSEVNLFVITGHSSEDWR